MKIMFVAIVLIFGLLGASTIAWLVWPRSRRESGPETNWEQRVNDEFPFIEGETEAPYDNVERGYGIAFGTGDPH